ncbi:hypothetical protein HDU82_001679 [Entophlyctis luteolus]|nr:hypothetical protein HDU82_001679 [Entophlyctis luteolus]
MAEVGELTRLIISSYEGEYETVAPPIASIKRHGTEAPRQPQKVFHGPGTVEFHSGHKYVGNFDKGFMHGDGEFTWYDGVKYSGQFVENKIQGEGEYTWNNGSKYVGQVQNGLRSGVGHFTCGGSVSSVEYVGEWKSGKLNGKGKLIYNKSGTSYYDGDWSNGLKHGYGVMQYETGNVYEGGWVDNVKEGYGEMKWKIRGEEYRGEWKASVRNLPMHNIYEGEWLNGQRCGFGIFVYASGARYEGEWKNNLKDGHGICIFENGRIFRGEFKLDKPVNDCGMFQNGLLIQTAHNWAFNFLAEHPFLFELKNLIGQDFSNCETVANHMRAVNNVILRHINDLREIYSHYSAIGPRLSDLESHGLQNHAMSQVQLWKFFDDCKLREKGISLAKLDRACVDHWKGDAYYNHLFQNPHNVSRQLIFHEFLDAILRVSQILYPPNKAQNSLPESHVAFDFGIAAPLSQMIKNDMLANLSLNSTSDDCVLQRCQTLDEHLFEDMENRFAQDFYRCYDELAHSNGRKTVTARMMLLFMNKSGMIDTDDDGVKHVLSISEFVRIFNSLAPEMAKAESDTYNLELELVPYEAFKGIFQCLLHKTHGIVYAKALETSILEAEANWIAAASATEAEDRAEKELAISEAEHNKGKEVDLAHDATGKADKEKEEGHLDVQAVPSKREKDKEKKGHKDTSSLKSKDSKEVKEKDVSPAVPNAFKEKDQFSKGANELNRSGSIVTYETKAAIADNVVELRKRHRASFIPFEDFYQADIAHELQDLLPGLFEQMLAEMKRKSPPRSDTGNDQPSSKTARTEGHEPATGEPQSSEEENQRLECAVMWFRRDLRVTDNTALSRAHEYSARANVSLIALFVISMKEWLVDHDMAPTQARLYLSALESLQQSLEQLNIPFLILNAERRQDVPELIRKAVTTNVKAKKVFWNREYEVHERDRDNAVVRLLDQSAIEHEACHDQCVTNTSVIRTKEGKPYTVFTPFKKSWIAHLVKNPNLLSLKDVPNPLETRAGDAIRKSIAAASTDIPKTLPSPHENPGQELLDRVYSTFPPSEKAALERLDAFLEHRVKSYSSDRDFPGKHGTSRLSFYLTLGLISPRVCLSRALSLNSKKFDSGNEGIVTWISELCWRDFYRNILIEFPQVSKNKPFKMETDGVFWITDPKNQLFQKWCTGNTGYPIVDAGMRQLLEDGWMHNRVRMITASFLTKDLGVDWRLGERHFMRHLVDGDLASNNGGWQWAASTGTDSQPYFRIFNPNRQSERFDPDGTYIRKYVKELAKVKGKEIHDPKFRAKLGYPPPIVDHKVASKAFLEVFKKGIDIYLRAAEGYVAAS